MVVGKTLMDHLNNKDVFIMKKLSFALVTCSILVFTGCNTNGAKEAGQPKRPECIAPAKPGGGLDMTCKLIQAGLKETEVLNDPIRVTYMPGGVGAVAYNKIVSNDSANNEAVIAFPLDHYSI